MNAVLIWFYKWFLFSNLKRFLSSKYYFIFIILLDSIFIFCTLQLWSNCLFFCNNLETTRYLWITKTRLSRSSDSRCMHKNDIIFLCWHKLMNYEFNKNKTNRLLIVKFKSFQEFWDWVEVTKKFVLVLQINCKAGLVFFQLNSFLRIKELLPS